MTGMRRADSAANEITIAVGNVHKQPPRATPPQRPVQIARFIRYRQYNSYQAIRRQRGGDCVSLLWVPHVRRAEKPGQPSGLERRSSTRSGAITEISPVKNDSGPFREPSGEAADGEASLDLLARAKAGDREALDALMVRYLPRLRRWARGRLPSWGRDITDTDDLVQDSMLQTFKRLDQFEVRHEAGLQAYLRQAVINRIRDECRRRERVPQPSGLDSRSPSSEASPLEIAIGAEALARYERALEALRAEDREAIVARVELGYSNQEIAAALGKPSANAARMAVERALLRLAEAMRDTRWPQTRQN